MKNGGIFYRCIRGCINSYSNKKNGNSYCPAHIDNVFDSEHFFEIGNAEGIIAYKDEIDYIIFRGSDSWMDWKNNIKFWKRTIPYEGVNKRIKVHTGFINQYKAVRDFIHGAVSNMNCIVFTGHSLGGAVATLAAVDIQYNFPAKKITLVTFGSPRVGNSAFERSFRGRVYDSWRYVNSDDAVCKVPCSLFGYRHIKNKIKIGNSKFYKIFGSIKDHYPEEYLRNMQ